MVTRRAESRVRCRVRCRARGSEGQGGHDDEDRQPQWKRNDKGKDTRYASRYRRRRKGPPFFASSEDLAARSTWRRASAAIDQGSLLSRRGAALVTGRKPYPVCADGL